jgi:hypothetical protein
VVALLQTPEELQALVGHVLLAVDTRVGAVPGQDGVQVKLRLAGGILGLKRSLIRNPAKCLERNDQRHETRTQRILADGQVVLLLPDLLAETAPLICHRTLGGSVCLEDRNPKINVVER